MQSLGAAGQRGRHVFLHRDFALELVVERVVHDAEAAFAEHSFDTVVAQPRAWRQRVAPGRMARHVPLPPTMTVSSLIDELQYGGAEIESRPGC
jgi:hypothetical protein